MKEIYVAGGCFWGVEHYYSLVRGILDTKCVYINSKKTNITYEETCQGLYEAVEGVHIRYDESEISLIKIVELLFRIIDPTSVNQQGNDVGVQYKTGIYTNDVEELTLIKAYVGELQKNYDQKIVVEITNLINVFDAEEYHQKYLNKNINGYCHVDMNKIKKEELK